MNGLQIKVINQNYNIMRSILIFVMILLNIGGTYAQDSFTYSIIEDDPDKGNKLYAGIGFTSSPIFGHFQTKSAFGPEIHAYNIFNRFALKFTSDFQTGLEIFKDKDNSSGKNVKLDKIRYYSADAIVTTELLSSTRLKKRKVTLRSYGSIDYISRIEHNRKIMLGLRLGYGILNAPFSDPMVVNNAYLVDSSRLLAYGYNQHSFSIGLTLSGISNLIFDTDIFGEIQEKEINNFYADILLPFKTTGKFCFVMMDSVSMIHQLNPIEIKSTKDYLDKRISFRVGWEKVFKLPFQNAPIAAKTGIEFVNRHHFDIDTERNFYLQIRLTLLGIVKP